MGLFYTFKADGEEKLLSTYVADPSDRYALQWLYEDFRLVDRQPFPMLMDVQVLKNRNPEGGVKIHYSVSNWTSRSSWIFQFLLNISVLPLRKY